MDGMSVEEGPAMKSSIQEYCRLVDTLLKHVYLRSTNTELFLFCNMKGGIHAVCV